MSRSVHRYSQIKVTGSSEESKALSPWQERVSPPLKKKKKSYESQKQKSKHKGMQKTHKTYFSRT